MRVCCKFVSSIDGKIATSPIESDTDRAVNYQFGSEEDKKRLLTTWRKATGAVMGTQTLLSNLDLWLPQIGGTDKRIYVLTRFGETFLRLSALPELASVIWVGTKKTRCSKALNYLYCEREDELAAKICFDAEEKNVDDLLVLGGAKVYQWFMNSRMLSDIEMTLAPHLFGFGLDVVSSLAVPMNLRLSTCEQVDQELFLSYQVLDSALVSGSNV